MKRDSGQYWPTICQVYQGKGVWLKARSLRQGSTKYTCSILLGVHKLLVVVERLCMVYIHVGGDWCSKYERVFVLDVHVHLYMYIPTQRLLQIEGLCK